MRRIIVLCAILVPVAAAAQQAPTTFLMPATTLAAIRQYLGSRPHDEVAAMIGMLEACASVQMPGRDGKAAPGGECRPVTDALAQQARERAAPRPPVPPGG